MSIARTQELRVEEIRKLALPLSTHILSGEGLLDRPISWTTVIHPEDDVLSKSVQEHELILIAQSNNPAKAHSDTELIQWAAKAGASAVVFCSPVSTTALAEAKARNLPVLSLPDDIRIREVEKTVISLLVNRKGQVERRGTQIYRQLTQISSRNEGMAGLIGAMARLTKTNCHCPRQTPATHLSQASAGVRGHLGRYRVLSEEAGQPAGRTARPAPRGRCRSASAHAGAAAFWRCPAGRAHHNQECRTRISIHHCAGRATWTR